MSQPQQHYYQTPGHVIAAGIVLSLLDIVVVTLRFVGRIRAKQPLKADDWLLVPATIMTVGVGACLVVGVAQEAFGYREIPTSGDNPSRESLVQMSMAIRLEWSIGMVLPWALACTRLSFIFFYKRIFGISPRVNRFLWGFVGFIIVWAFVFFLATLLCCWVMTVGIWRPIAEMAQCNWFLEIFVGFCVTGFVTDLIIIAIPIPLIRKLNLSRPKKLMACASFLLGAVTIACALARFIVSVQFLREANDPSSDYILNMTIYVYWAMVEASMGVFAACLPTLQFYFRRWEFLSTKTRGLFSMGSRTSGSKSLNGSGSPKTPTFDVELQKGSCPSASSSSPSITRDYPRENP